MKTIKDVLKKYGVYPEELLKELEEYKIQAIKKAFDETRLEKKFIKDHYCGKNNDDCQQGWGREEGYNQAIEDQKVAQDKFLKI